MIKDFTKRLQNALRDAKFKTDGVLKMLEWLDKSRQYYNVGDYNSATMAYNLTKISDLSLFSLSTFGLIWDCNLVIGMRYHANVVPIESFFSKMTKQMLKGIRVQSKQELADRIYLYFDEVNADPVVYHWTYKLDEISIGEAKSNVAS